MLERALGLLLFSRWWVGLGSKAALRPSVHTLEAFGNEVLCVGLLCFVETKNHIIIIFKLVQQLLQERKGPWLLGFQNRAAEGQRRPRQKKEGVAKLVLSLGSLCV